MDRPLVLGLVGLLLFAFIPVVLYLYVVHPEPVRSSLFAGLVLMLAHPLLARPYMRRAMPRQCLWCKRAAPEAEALRRFPEELSLEAAGGPQLARFCAGHREPAVRFFRFVERFRWLLLPGIFLPLLVLLFALLTADGRQDPALVTATNVFRLVIGITVNVAAWGWLVVPARSVEEAPKVPFPLHNFTLLGLRALLWVFRLVGIWWIVAGLTGLLS